MGARPELQRIAAHRRGVTRALGAELHAPPDQRLRGARPGLCRSESTGASAMGPNVGAPLERGVRPHCWTTCERKHCAKDTWPCCHSKRGTDMGVAMGRQMLHHADAYLIRGRAKSVTACTSKTARNAQATAEPRAMTRKFPMRPNPPPNSSDPLSKAYTAIPGQRT